MQLETALHILGIEDLRPFQKEALNTLLTGRNLLTLMPTSAGKSLIFTSFAMVQERRRGPRHQRFHRPGAPAA